MRPSDSPTATVPFRVVKPCDRCVITLTDQGTAERGQDPLRTLARHHRTGKDLLFGQYLIPDGTGVIRVGDPVPLPAVPAPGCGSGPTWTDARRCPPMDVPTAHTHAALAGFGVMVLGVALIEGGRRLIVWRMVQWRYARLDQAWAEAGPDWGRTGTGS